MIMGVLRLRSESRLSTAVSFFSISRSFVAYISALDFTGHVSVALALAAAEAFSRP